MHESLAEGTRVGQFVVLRDIDGRTHAVAAGAVAAICETDDGALIMLPGGSWCTCRSRWSWCWRGWSPA